VTHTESHALLAAGAALDDLEPAELDDLAALLTACPACARLETELDIVMADLALATPERVPPPDLLAGIRAAIAASPAIPASRAAEGITAVPRAPVAGLASVVRSATPSAVVGAPLLFIRRPVVAGLALAAALAIVAVGLGVRTASLGSDLEGSRAEVATLRTTLADQGAVMAVAMDPRHVTASLAAQPLAPAAVANVVYVPGTSESWIVASDLPPTPAGRAYQLWWADATGVHPLATASYAGSGAFMADLGVDLSTAAAVMITLEPAGGSTGQPGPEVVFGKL
jgi:hypothetical protein